MRRAEEKRMIEAKSEKGGAESEQNGTRRCTELITIVRLHTTEPLH